MRLPTAVIGSSDTSIKSLRKKILVSVSELMNTMKEEASSVSLPRDAIFPTSVRIWHISKYSCLVANGLSAMFDEGNENLIACLGVYYISNGVPTNSALSWLSETRDEYLKYSLLLDFSIDCETDKYFHASYTTPELVRSIPGSW